MVTVMMEAVMIVVVVVVSMKTSCLLKINSDRQTDELTVDCPINDRIKLLRANGVVGLCITAYQMFGTCIVSNV